MDTHPPLPAVAECVSPTDSGVEQLSCVTVSEVTIFQLSIPPSTVFPVFVSVGTTNYTAMNSQIAIDTIGDTAESALTCRTDLTTCCRGLDNPSGSSGSGEWIFPNGTAVARSRDLTESDTDVFHFSRNTSVVFLNRRGSVSGPTGSYCCVLPASTGEVTFCVELGK